MTSQSKTIHRIIGDKNSIVIDVCLQVKVHESRCVVLFQMFRCDGHGLHETLVLFGQNMDFTVLAEGSATLVRVRCFAIHVGHCA